MNPVKSNLHSPVSFNKKLFCKTGSLNNYQIIKSLYHISLEKEKYH